MTLSKNTNDRALIRGCVRKDKKSWDLFVEQFSDLIYDSILRTFRQFGHHADLDLCDDIHNDVFVRLMENHCQALKLFEGRNGCQLPHYLRTIAVRKTIDFLRRLKPMASLDQEVGELCDGGISLELKEAVSVAPEMEELEHQDAQLIAKELLSDLTPKERQLCEMFFYEGKDSVTVSKRLGMSVDYFYVAKQRVLSKLKKIAEAKKVLEL